MPNKSGVVVLNPGSSPEMTRIAVGLARAGMLRELVIPIGATSPQVSRKVARFLPGPIRDRLANELRRRQLPPPLQDGMVQHVATPAEYAAVAIGRIGPLRLARPYFERLKNAWLDRGVAGSLRPSDLALVTSYGSAVRSLRRARVLSVSSFLEYPIAHPHYAEALLKEEAVLCPEFAATMPPNWPDWLRTQFDDEISISDRIFMLSSFHMRTFADCGVDVSKLILTPLGVDLDLFQPRGREEDGVFRILFVGQMTQRKGISYLIEAFDRVAIPRSELVMVGPMVGTSRPWRGHRALRYEPAVPRWELPAFYGTADVYVLPSLLEGFSLTALEAMACGLPVIISENTFGRDVVRDGVEGYVVPIRDTDSIIERLRYLHGHPNERRRMGEAARRRAEAFSWTQYEDLVVTAITSNR